MPCAAGRPVQHSARARSRTRPLFRPHLYRRLARYTPVSSRCHRPRVVSCLRTRVRPHGSAGRLELYACTRPHLTRKLNFLSHGSYAFLSVTRKYLGAALGSKTFTEEYVSQKVQEWTRQILKLSEVAIFQPHAAHAAYVHGLSYRWSYLIRTISDIEDLLQPLENTIHQHFIPALTGRPPCSSSERDLLSLPTRLGGLSIRDPSEAAAECFRSSERITAPLVALIITQDIDETVDSDTSVAIKNEIKKQNRQRHDEQARAVYDQLTPELKRCTDLSKEKGSSAWLCVLPFEEHGFYLHKGEFRDALCLRYGWKVKNTPHSCNCGAQFTVDHAMICHMGGFPTIRHNEIRDITASLLTEVCNNVATEPALQPLNGESMTARSANTDDGVRADIRARGFWNRSQDAFFDVRVFYPNASSNRSTNATSVYRRHEQAKKREYGQ